MKIERDIFVLEDIAGFSPNTAGVHYRDINGTRVFIPMKVLVHLYDGAKFHLTKNGQTLKWKKFCDSLFAKVEEKHEEEDIGEALNALVDASRRNIKSEYVPHKKLDLKKTATCKAPVREALLQYIRSAGTIGRKFTEIQRYYVEAIWGYDRYDSKKHRGCGCIMFYGHGQFFAQYCFKKDGKWILNEFKNA